MRKNPSAVLIFLCFAMSLLTHSKHFKCYNGGGTTDLTAVVSEQWLCYEILWNKKKKAGLIFVKMSENNTLHTLHMWTRSAVAEATTHSHRYSKHSECLIALACVRACVRTRLACVRVFSQKFCLNPKFFFLTILITRCHTQRGVNSVFLH